MVTRNEVQKKVKSLRAKHGLPVYPVNLGKLVKLAGAEIRYNTMDDLSGFAYKNNNTKIIGVNTIESGERQRFTIAHELGHLFLHKKETVSYDTGSLSLHLRDSHSSDGTDIKEIEANSFAAELLMPEEIIREDVKRLGQINLEDEKAIKKLAKKYKVSSQAMTVRLTTLYFKKA